MPSFSKMGAFPAGYFRGVAQWLLQNRRDLPARIAVISAEITRIGFVRMTYKTKTDGDGNTIATEEPLGISVNQGSTLAKLMQAYIANGGNPFNICKFLMPNRTTTAIVDDKNVRVESYPGGGVVAPLSVEYNDPLPVVEEGDPTSAARTGYENYRGGHLNTDRYYPNRMNSRKDRGSWDSDTVVRTMHDIRRWANQDIKTRLQDMEWRIIKQMDLREQLVNERDTVITQAFGSLQDGVPEFDPESFRKERMVPVIIDEMAKLISQVDPTTAELIGSGASSQTGFLSFTFSDVTSEVHNTL